MGATIQGTVWAQWVHHASTGGTHTMNVGMNNRNITVATALRSYVVTHPGVPHLGVFDPAIPPSLEIARVGVKEVEWSNGNTLTHPGWGWPTFVMYNATRLKFQLSNADAVLGISYFNTGEVFAP